MSQSSTGYSRRDFMKVAGLAGAGLMISVSLFRCKDDSPQGPLKETEINAFIRINEDGTATILAKNPEIGQGIRTSLPMILAEELELSWEKVTVEQAMLDQRLGPQYAGGSQGITTNYEALRKAGAAAKAVLIAAAAAKWEVSPDQCKVKGGIISNGSKELHYGEVAEAAAKLDLPEEPSLKDPKDFKIIGKSTADVDLQKIVTGQPLFGLDQELEGMVYATVLKPPVMGSTVVSFDAAEAKNIPGVIDVIKIEKAEFPGILLEGIGIVAYNVWAAFKAKKAIKVEWQKPESYVTDMESLFDTLEKTAQDGEVLREEGDVGKEFRGNKNTLEATYKVPFLCHSQMEPMNFIADVKEDSIRLIGPTQTPGSAAGQASQLTGIPPENITVEFTRIGGGFGRRLLNDYANEAVYLSQRIKKPVKIVWDRENDFLTDYYRPAGVYQFKASLRGSKLTGFEVKGSTTSRNLYGGRGRPPHSTEIFPDQEPAGMVPHFKLSYKPLLTNVPVGALRVPGVNATTFAYQCFLDELAEKAGMDPIEFHLQLIGTEAQDLKYDDHGGPTYNTGKLRTVIEKVRDASGWGNPAPAGRYRGFSGQMVFGVYVAEVAEISMVNGKVKVHKITAAIDCGRVINPLGADAQVQGGITDALSAALYESISFKDGALQETNFDRYQKLRMKDSPEVEVHFIPSDEHPKGLGEPSYPVVFPALCNAVYAATAQRVRELPLKLHGLA